MKSCYLGIDLGGTNFKYGVLDPASGIRTFKTSPIADIAYPDKAVDKISGLIFELSKRYEIKSAGLGVPGLVDFKTGYIHSLTNLRRWKNLHFKKMLEEKVGLPVLIDNDANLAALAEYCLGSGEGSVNMLMVTLGTGVGGGLILNGQIYRGINNAAGEIGHIPLSLNGPLCNCGGRGCLEAYIGNKRLLAYLNRRLKKEKSILNNRSGQIELKDVSIAAQRGDNLSVDFWKYTAGKLAQALIGAVNLLNIDRIVIGGGISDAGPFLIRPLKEYLKCLAMDIQAKNVKIVKARFRGKAGVIGASLLAKHQNNMEA
ncbi:MAG TPA: ROK family protein [Candidatus Omnitrophica bacterium]|nr:ROK family protein [Candidatus Omnitrophota bacterium]